MEKVSRYVIDPLTPMSLDASSDQLIRVYLLHPESYNRPRVVCLFLHGHQSCGMTDLLKSSLQTRSPLLSPFLKQSFTKIKLLTRC